MKGIGLQMGDLGRHLQDAWFQKHLLDLHKRVKKGVLYVGTPGTGKTTIVHDFFADTDAKLDDSDVQHTQVNFNNYTTSQSL